MKLSREEASELATALGVTDAAHRHVTHAPSLDEAQRRLDELKANVRKRLRILARELHPDVTGDDPEKTERLKRLTFVASTIERAKLVQPPPPAVWVQTHFYSSTGTATTTGYTRTW